VTLVVGEERHVSTFALTRTDKRSVYFDALERTKTAPDLLRAQFVGRDTVKLSRQGDPQVLLLKRAK
jgi:hypothetical protein